MHRTRTPIEIRNIIPSTRGNSKVQERGKKVDLLAKISINKKSYRKIYSLLCIEYFKSLHFILLEELSISLGQCFCLFNTFVTIIFSEQSSGIELKNN